MNFKKRDIIYDSILIGNDKDRVYKVVAIEYKFHLPTAYVLKHLSSKQMFVSDIKSIDDRYLLRESVGHPQTKLFK